MAFSDDKFRRSYHRQNRTFSTTASHSSMALVAELHIIILRERMKLQRYLYAIALLLVVCAARARFREFLSAGNERQFEWKRILIKEFILVLFVRRLRFIAYFVEEFSSQASHLSCNRKEQQTRDDSGSIAKCSSCCSRNVYIIIGNSAFIFPHSG